VGLLAFAVALAAPIWTWTSDGSPLRIGLRVPREAVADGLALRGEGQLQWRPLPVRGHGDDRTADSGGHDEVWIELAILAPRGRVQVVAGGRGPDLDGRGAAFVLRREQRRVAHGLEQTTRWEWCDGTVDERCRVTFTAATEIAGERFEAGEGWTRQSPGLATRARWWQRAGRAEAERCGLLPVRGRGGGTTARLRRHLGEVVDALVEMPGARGAGDFRRADGEVTNLEFDTAFALLRCAVALQHARAFVLAQRCAAQLRDRDLDLRSGLPFVHGVDHRTGVVETGHVWLRGLLWVGLLTADDDALVAARALGRSLAVNLPQGTGRNERLRSYAWPLAELEALLRVTDEPIAARAADRLAAAIALRYDPSACTWRFGEGRQRDGSHFERAWLTAGLLLPALRAHHARRPAEPLRDQIDAASKRLAHEVGRGVRGLPTHYRLRRGRSFAHHFERGTVRSTWLLEAFDARRQRQLFGRAAVRRATTALPALDDPDLPTTFTMLGRCDWPWH
jgi:hypothetical protein